jgi:hypothetical protein
MMAVFSKSPGKGLVWIIPAVVQLCFLNSCLSQGAAFLQRPIFADLSSTAFCKPSWSRRHQHNAQLATFNMAGFGGGGSENKKSSKKVRTISKNAPGAGTKPLRDAANTFDALYKESNKSKDILVDVYVRAPANNEEMCWFVGKVARQTVLEKCQGSSLPTFEEAILSQKRLIFEYAKHLRPQNIGGPFSKGLELLYGPGNSEMDVVQNKVELVPVRGSATKDISDTFSVKDVGYNPEIYLGDEINQGGLRVLRDKDGNPIKAEFEINASS